MKEKTKTIRVDLDVYAKLQENVIDPFTDTPNKVLRRVLGCDENVQELHFLVQ